MDAPPSGDDAAAQPSRPDPTPATAPDSNPGTPTDSSDGTPGPRPLLIDRVRAWWQSLRPHWSALLTRSNLLTSALLGAVSLLIAFTAFQASQYGDEAARLGSIANRISVDTINQFQSAYARNNTDVQIWLQIVGSGETVDTSPLTGLLSPGFLDAIRRDQAIKGTATGALTLPTDTRYWDELTIAAQSKNDQLEQAYDSARTAGAISSRMTGASVIYSAALLLLTLGASTTKHGTRVALSAAAAAIIIIALAISAAPIRWFE